MTCVQGQADSGAQGARSTVSLLFQPAEGTAVMPDRLNLNLNRIFALVVALSYLLDELAHLIRGHPLRLNPTHLAAMDSMMALSPVHCSDGILGVILTISISQIEMIRVIKSIANRPMVVGHGLHQIVLAFKLLE